MIAGGNVCAFGGGTCLDVAELYPVTDDATAGDIVEADMSTSTSVRKAQGGVVIGIVSTNPALLIEGSRSVLGAPSATSGPTTPRQQWSG